MLQSRRGLAGWMAALALGSAGCPSDPRPRDAVRDAGMGGTATDTGADAGTSVGSTLGTSDGTEQQPPTTGRAASRAWLAAGAWRRWRCEASAHPAIGLSAHGYDRICNNDALANAPPGAPWPVGSASVKEIHDPGDPDQVIGYSTYLKVRDGSDGSNWFWFQYVRPEVALELPAPREPDGTMAEGFGDRGGALRICVSCHARSGTDDAGSQGFGDFVYFRVPN